MKYNIDYTKTASLTLYKYEMSDVSKATHGGTGEKNDEQYIPSDAKRLAGVTFTVRKVAELSTYFKPDGVSLPTASAAKSMSPIGNPISKKTDANGVAVFSDLPLGIYYVEETVLRRSPRRSSPLCYPFRSPTRQVPNGSTMCIPIRRTRQAIPTSRL